jgi:putative endonuclease
VDFGSGPYWTYVLENTKGKLYIGSTGNLTQRIEQHNYPSKDFPAFTHKYGPWKLIWAASHPTRSDAVKCERQIKRMKSAKWIRQNLLNADVSGQTGGC